MLKIEYVIADKLKKDLQNPRKISPADLKALKRSIGEFGFVDPVIARKEDGLVIGGHQRLAAVDGEKVPVVYLEGLSDEKARLLNVALNKISGEFDLPKLAELMVELKDEDLTLTGFTDGEVKRLLESVIEAPEEGEQLPVVDEKDLYVKPGDLWKLGNHHLFIGDAMDAPFTVGGDTIMITDPPYGVNYDPEWRDDAPGQIASKNRKKTKVAKDDNADWTPVFKKWNPTVLYCWHGALHSSIVAAGLQEIGFSIRAQIIWRKQHFVFGRGHYHWNHEPCWYAVKEGKNSKWVGDRTQSTVWDIENANPMGGKKDDENTPHSTQKPIDCMMRPMKNHDFKIVLDPFGGSGTTLIAAETLGRHCFMAELDPCFGQVIIERWKKLTGKTADKLP